MQGEFKASAESLAVNSSNDRFPNSAQHIGHIMKRFLPECVLIIVASFGELFNVGAGAEDIVEFADDDDHIDMLIIV